MSAWAGNDRPRPRLDDRLRERLLMFGITPDTVANMDELVAQLADDAKMYGASEEHPEPAVRRTSLAYFATMGRS